MNKEKKMNSISHARAAAATSITSLTHRELFMLGLGLYWGEGVKADSSALAIINSDPEIIRIAMRWFADCYSVDRDRFRPRVFINELHRSREKSVLHFWSEKIGLPKKQFSKVVFIKRVNRKVYENHNTYYGVLALRISKGTVLRYRILADIERISGRQYLPV